MLLVVQGAKPTDSAADWVRGIGREGDHVYLCTPRGLGPTRWTRKNPPNYVERCHVLLGRTVDTGRVWDVAAMVRHLRAKYDGEAAVCVAGQAAAGVLGAYAALWEPDVAEVVLNRPPLDHMLVEAPQFLNVLRVCNVPDALGMLAPRPLKVLGPGGGPLKKVARIYASAGAPAALALEAESVNPTTSGPVRRERD